MFICSGDFFSLSLSLSPFYLFVVFSSASFFVRPSVVWVQLDLAELESFWLRHE